jgi:hypothetical protein
MENSGELDGTVGGTGFSKNGGLVGVTTSGTFTNNIVEVLKEIKTKPADTTNRGLIGSSGSSSCVDNRYLSTADNDSCQSAGNLNASAMYNLAGYPGSFDFAAETFWKWPTDDRGHDIPRLTWEVAKENEVPYLKRLCSNLWIEANRTGTGDSISSPRSVCNMSQLLNMIAGEKKPGYAGSTVGWQKRPLRTADEPGSRPTMKLIWSGSACPAWWLASGTANRCG